MTVLTPPGYVQGGTYTAKLDRIYNTTTRVFPDTGQALRARQGFYTGRAPVYANPSGWNVTMGACGGVIANTFASNAGDYEFANDGSVQVTVAASSPTLNRQDVIGFQVKDNLFDSSGLNSAIPAVIQGANSAGASSDPSLPSSFIPVVRAVVPAGSTAPTLQSMIQYTTNDGGLLRINSVTERAAITAPSSGMQNWRHDKGFAEWHDGTAWRVPSGALVNALADVTNPRTNQTVILSSDSIEYRWTGGVWVALRRVTSAGLSLFERTTDQNFNNTELCRVDFTTTVQAGSDVVKSSVGAGPPGLSAGSAFTLQRDGWYEIIFNCSFAGNVTGLLRDFHIGLINDTARYGSVAFAPAGFYAAASVKVKRPFTSGTQFSMFVFQDSGGVLSSLVSQAPVNVSFEWKGPL